MRENGRRENRVVQHAECGLGARLGAEEPLLARFGRLLEPMATACHVSLDSLFRAALMTDACHDNNDFDSFMSATASPGLAAVGRAAESQVY